MKVLHFMKQEKFTKGIVEFYNKHFCEKGHEICYINLGETSSNIRMDIEIPQYEIFLNGNIFKNAYTLYKTAFSYDYVIVHSYQFNNWLLLFLFLDKRLLKRVVWIEWGADLYSWKRVSKGIKAKVLNYIGYIVRVECNSVICIFPPDCDVYRKEFPNSKAKLYYAPYCGARVPNEYKKFNEHSRLSITKINNEPIYIQVGHCATKMVGHIEVLNSLSIFSNENIRIFLPLNYGDMDYADKVQAYAEKLFPQKVICLRNMLPQNEYYELLNRVDIAIFNTYRQIALGNILTMIYKKVKIYMPEDSIMYNYFKSNAVPIQSFESINKGKFDDLISEIEIEDKEKFLQHMSQYSDENKRLAPWLEIYEELEKSLVMSQKDKNKRFRSCKTK